MTTKFFEIRYNTGTYADDKVSVEEQEPEYAHRQYRNETEIITENGKVFISTSLSDLLHTSADRIAFTFGKKRFFLFSEEAFENAMHHISYPSRSDFEQKCRNRNLVIIEKLMELA